MKITGVSATRRRQLSARQLRAGKVKVALEVTSTTPMNAVSAPGMLASNIGKEHAKLPLPPAYAASGATKPVLPKLTGEAVKLSTMVEVSVPLKASSSSELDTATDGVLKSLDAAALTTEIKKQNPSVYADMQVQDVQKEKSEMLTAVPTKAETNAPIEPKMAASMLAVIVIVVVGILVFLLWCFCSPGGTADAARKPLGIGKPHKKGEKYNA